MRLAHDVGRKDTHARTCPGIPAGSSIKAAQDSYISRHFYVDMIFLHCTVQYCRDRSILSSLGYGLSLTLSDVTDLRQCDACLG